MERYEMVKEIGSGNFDVAKLVRDKGTRELFAVKFIEMGQKSFCTEISQENINFLWISLEYLINISYVDNTEVFKVCLDYWNSLVLELFEANHNLENLAATANMMGLQMPLLLPGMGDGLSTHCYISSSGCEYQNMKPKKKK
ncbi:hypothetical protein L1987_03475 [Smallanthus sonchifolius]|uniref:Uncharacterized protein n=1 Tax=Smallanthus sonchifolius TaxID=185202 RepID=A0ACB9KAZ4_9ASTR|nr:hypothetical protein L1987_03475 [Smallanthus sonchifolius]